MKNTILILTLLFMSALLLAEDQITIYNNDFALVRSTLSMDVQKGVHSFFLSDIPSTIEATSVIVNSKDKFEIHSQNFEYDLANSSKILEKYINVEVDLLMENGNNYSGKLQFYDSKSIGLIDKNTKKLLLVKEEEIQRIELAELPSNFFLKPTLHWIISSPKTEKVSTDYSYLCSGMRWDVTYNAVWDDTHLRILPWVTINNNTGKAFENVKLKMIAGDVQKQYARGGRGFEETSMDGLTIAHVTAKAAPTFEQKEFHDFHMYTLSDKVSINNNQTKQLVMFPEKTVTAKAEYNYTTFGNTVTSLITFKNSEKEGLGLPLPRGKFNIYREDKADNQMEFIGEDSINHTPLDEEIKLTTGKAFDIVAETIVKNENRQRNQYEREILVTIKNKSKVAKSLVITHRLSGPNWTITENNFKYDKTASTTIEVKKDIKPNEEINLSWKEVTYYN
ncbi:MAG: DUF4139 domain-containing protein [Candidatus Cloacimonetes bacterium]|nr:DUF4139 domain-containing protein [Candidatus Cloacimonadota bacterium]